MLKVKVKTQNNLNLSIPVPYPILHIIASILTSEMLLKQITRMTNHHAGNKDISFTPLAYKLPKKLLKQTIRELHSHKGLVLVDVKLKDGTEVFVRL